MHEPTGPPIDSHVVAGIERRDGAIIVRLAGELDLYNAGAAREPLFALAAELPERLVIDLEAVEFLDSTALGLLIEVRARLADRRTFLLAAPGLESRRALAVSGLDKHLPVHDTVEAALAAPLK